jgi:hypothetical protein
VWKVPCMLYSEKKSKLCKNLVKCQLNAGLGSCNSNKELEYATFDICYYVCVSLWGVGFYRNNKRSPRIIHSIYRWKLDEILWSTREIHYNVIRRKTFRPVRFTTIRHLNSVFIVHCPSQNPNKNLLNIPHCVFVPFVFFNFVTYVGNSTGNSRTKAANFMIFFWFCCCVFCVPNLAQWMRYAIIHYWCKSWTTNAKMTILHNGDCNGRMSIHPSQNCWTVFTLCEMLIVCPSAV